ncbi:MAG: type II secretion system F family protein [Burkholderiales bacterium]
MIGALVFGALFGLGALSVLTAQPHGAPHPTLAVRLAALRPKAEPEVTKPKARVFRTEVFEQILRPHIEHVGEALARVLGRFGLDVRATEERLRMSGDQGGLALFFGQKLASGLIGFAFLPAAGALGIAPQTPQVVWLGMAAFGFLLPDLVLRSRAQAARRRLREELVRLTEMLTLAVSAGLGLEGALEQAVTSVDGRLFAEVRRVLREAQLRGEPASKALARLPGDIGLPEIEPLTTAIRTAAAQGTPITQALRAQARAVRERRRLELIEAGERAQIRMLLPVGALILPAFFVVVLYPAAVQLLRVTGL